MENTQKQLENYTITSPISGTVIDKEYKAGDTVESGKTLCTIYDLSYLEMTLNIDELDISTVEAGQTVQITAEAVEGKTFPAWSPRSRWQAPPPAGSPPTRSPSVSTRPTACCRA